MEIDQLPPADSWVVLDVTNEPLTIENITNGRLSGAKTNLANWTDADEESFAKNNISIESLLAQSTLEEGGLGGRFDLFPGEETLDSFAGVRMQFRAMNVREDGQLNLTNFRIAFVYTDHNMVSTCKYSSIPNTTVQYIGTVERYAAAPARSASPSRLAPTMADSTHSQQAPQSSLGLVATAYNSLMASSEIPTSQGGPSMIQSSQTQSSIQQTVTIYGIEIRTKDVRRIRFYFRARADRDRALSLMQSWCFFGTSVLPQLRIFAFPHGNAVRSGLRNGLEQPSARPSDWIYSIEEEFKRLDMEKARFMISSINESYRICPTYPQQVILPATVDEAVVSNSASFRSSGRFPSVCWLDPQTGATISRCSQPQVGIRGLRNTDDEALVDAIFSLNSNAGKQMYIIDCRPQTAAAANYIKGAGYENTNYYRNCKLMFMNIQNIHAMRSSFKSLCDLCARETGEVPDRNSFESTKWFEHIQLLLKAALQMAKLVREEGRSLLVHCSDGWDRTPQLVSLVQILLDPFYRTIRGFCILIQKEWLAFGHKFGQRLGVGLSEDQSPEISPIFIQWLDCIFQMQSQFPSRFEFTEEFLTTLLDHVLSNRFGDFLFNCERERVEADVPHRTASIWEHFQSEIADRLRKGLDPLYVNPNSRAHKKAGPGQDALVPVISTSKFYLWDRYYQRYHFKFQELHHETADSRAATRRATELQKENRQLKGALASVSREREMLHAALQAALLAQQTAAAAATTGGATNASAGAASLDQLKHELDKLNDRHLTPAQQQNLQIQFYIKDGVVVKCSVKEEGEAPPSATKFVPDLAKFTIENYSGRKRRNSSSGSSSSTLPSVDACPGPLIKIQEPPGQHSPTKKFFADSSVLDDDIEDYYYYDYDERARRRASTEAVPGGVPMQLLSIGYSEFMKYWSRLWGGKTGGP